MKDMIKFYYNLDGEIVEDNLDCALFLCDDTYYYFIKYNRTQEELNDILQVVKEMQDKHIKSDEVIPNIHGTYLTNEHVLVKISYFLNDELTIKDIMRYNKQLHLSSKYVNNWANLWKEKIDYLEYQIRELGKDKKILIHSFSYYIGMAEDALLMLSKIERRYSPNSHLVLSRVRVGYPAYAKDYFNPVQYIFDNPMRDIAEYLKSKFFAGEDIQEDLKCVFSQPYTPYEYNMFYARMLYPSYYFDLYEDIILNKKEEKELYAMLNKIDDYEYFLKDLYFYLSKYCQIEQVEWITKKGV